MTSVKIPNHIHRYKRVDLTRKKGKAPFLVFKCTKPICQHYVPLTLAEGKMCECNRCGEPMIIDKVALTLKLPHCIDCTKSKKVLPADINAINEFLNRPKE